MILAVYLAVWWSLSFLALSLLPIRALQSLAIAHYVAALAGARRCDRLFGLQHVTVNEVKWIDCAVVGHEIMLSL